MEAFIRKHTANMGKARFYLKDHFYWVELDEDVCEVVMKEVNRLSKIIAKPVNIEDLLVEVENTSAEVHSNPALRDLI